MILFILQIIICVLLIVAIVLQMQGSGLSTAFGGAGEFYRSKRSIEKMLVWITIGLAFIFAALSVMLLFPH